LGSAAVSLLLVKRRVRGEDPPTSPPDAWSETTRHAFLRYALPLVPLASFNWIMSLSDRYILAGVSGAGAAGLYAAAYGLGSQPFIVVNALIHSTLRPVLYDAVSRGDAVKERRTLRTWLGLVVAVSAGGLLLVLLLARPITR